jgi:hypothetical protein
MFRDNCDINTVIKVVPHAARRTLFRMQHNMDLFGQVRKPSSAVKQRGRPRLLTPLMRVYAMELLAHRNDLWEEELAFELWCEFDITVSQPTISRMLKEERLSSKVNTRIANRRSIVEQGLYEEELAELMSQGHPIGVDPMYMLLYLDESAASEKVMFRRRSWSAIGLPALQGQSWYRRCDVQCCQH